MRQLGLKQISIIIFLGALGWALCGAIMFIGMEVTSMQITLIAHAIGAPVIFTTISWIYHSRFGSTKPLTTAAVFLGIVIFLDIFPVATVINRSFEMFTTVLGTWFPWALIFLSTYLTGLLIERQSREPRSASS